jgi:hypothetical protein
MAIRAALPSLDEVGQKPFRAAILRLLGPGGRDPAKLDRIIETLALKAENGDVASAVVIRDSVDGRPAQEISGPNGGPISMEFRTFYEPLLAGSGPTIEHEPAQIGPQSASEAPEGPENAG